MRKIHRFEGKRIDINNPITIGEITYPNIKDIWREVGVEEIEVEDYPNLLEFTFSENIDGSLNITPLPAEKVFENKAKLYEKALDAYLDKVARSYRYDSRFTFALRAGYPNDWQAEGLAFGQWMDTCNKIAYQELAAVAAGTKPMPASPEAFIATLPAFPLGAFVDE